jgi:hypothetical protein
MPGGVSMFVVKELQAHAAFHAREAFHLKKSEKRRSLEISCTSLSMGTQKKTLLLKLSY